MSRIGQLQYARAATMPFSYKAIRRQDIEGFPDREPAPLRIGEPIDFQQSSPLWRNSPRKNLFAQTHSNIFFQQAAWLAGVFLRIVVHRLG